MTAYQQGTYTKVADFPVCLELHVPFATIPCMAA